MHIYASSEDYLEAILIIKKRRGMVRSIDIASELGYSKPSVSVAMKKLRENGYIEMDAHGLISLLPPGSEIAERIYERHRTLSDFFVYIGVSPETAVRDACKVEHNLSPETFDRLKEHIRQTVSADLGKQETEQEKA